MNSRTMDRHHLKTAIAGLALTLVLWLALASPAANSGSWVTGVDDLLDKRIGLMVGTTQDLYATEHYTRATIVRYKNASDILMALKTGKIDAAIFNNETLKVLMRTDQSVTTIGEPLIDSPVGAGFNPQADSLREAFNAFLQTIRADGTYADMLRRWMDEGVLTMPELANDETNGTLTVGFASDKGLPFASLVQGRMVGFEIELAERFAAVQNKRLVLQDLDFGSLIAAVATGKIDLCLSSMSITAERAKKIDFSDPYYHVGVIFMVRTADLANGPATPTPGAPATVWTQISRSFVSNLILENRYRLILSGLGTTAILAVFSAVLGTLLGVLACGLRLARSSPARRLAQAYIVILRGLPALVLLLIIFYVVLGAVQVSPLLVAVIAFGLHFSAYAAEMFRSAILSVDSGQTEAGIAGGFTRLQTFWHIVLPQAVRQVMPVYKGELISLLKMTSVVGYIAVEDLTKAGDIIRSRTFDAFFPLLLVAALYFGLSGLMIAALSFAERRSGSRWIAR